ncbi:MAG TPA: 4Fe-4S dicluster domain-containing protein [Bacteroidales bacterium]|nr:4Fe-4S dicluster domain-containing protein [Bacteroidales bacterium]
MEQYIIDKDALEKLFNTLRQKESTVVAPILRNNKIVYGVTENFNDIQFDFIQTAQSAKEVTFPRNEKLFSYKKEKDSVTLQDIDTETIHNVVVWGTRPCDALAGLPLKVVFNWDYKDKLFNTRLDKTTLISFSCRQADEYCFCTSLGGDPGSTEGSDMLLSQLGDSKDYLVEIVTEKGKAVFDIAPDLFHKSEKNIEKKKYLANVPVRFQPEEISKKLKALIGSEVWVNQSMRCLGCGACAFVCPVCACFDIQDEMHGKNGVRVRCWDSCGFSLFTMHTSGHNPREVLSKRWRQRVLHKFSYMPERLSVYGCTGCGRCSRACPADMNIVEHLISIQEERQ